MPYSDGYDDSNERRYNAAGLLPQLRLLSHETVAEYNVDDTLKVRSLIDATCPQRSEQPDITYAMATGDDHVSAMDFRGGTNYLPYAVSNGDIFLLKINNNRAERHVSSIKLDEYEGEYISHLSFGNFDKGLFAACYTTCGNPFESTVTAIDLVTPRNEIVHYDTDEAVNSVCWSWQSSTDLMIATESAVRICDVRDPFGYRALFLHGGLSHVVWNQLRTTEFVGYRGNDLMFFDTRCMHLPFLKIALDLDNGVVLDELRYHTYFPEELYVHTSDQRVRVFSIKDEDILVRMRAKKPMLQEGETATFQHIESEYYGHKILQKREKILPKRETHEVTLFGYYDHYEMGKCDNNWRIPKIWREPDKSDAYTELPKDYRTYADVIGGRQMPANEPTSFNNISKSAVVISEKQNVRAFDYTIVGNNGIIVWNENNEYILHESAYQYEAAAKEVASTTAVKNFRMQEWYLGTSPHMFYKMYDRLESGWNIGTHEKNLMYLVNLVTKNNEHLWANWLRNIAVLQYSAQEWVKIDDHRDKDPSKANSRLKDYELDTECDENFVGRLLSQFGLIAPIFFGAAVPDAPSAANVDLGKREKRHSSTSERTTSSEITPTTSSRTISAALASTIKQPVQSAGRGRGAVPRFMSRQTVPNKSSGVRKLIIATQMPRPTVFEPKRVSEEDLVRMLHSFRGFYIDAIRKKVFGHLMEYNEKRRNCLTPTEQQLETLKLAVKRADQMGWSSFFDRRSWRGFDLSMLDLEMLIDQILTIVSGDAIDADGNVELPTPTEAMNKLLESNDENTKLLANAFFENMFTKQSDLQLVPPTFEAPPETREDNGGKYDAQRMILDLYNQEKSEITVLENYPGSDENRENNLMSEISDSPSPFDKNILQWMKDECSVSSVSSENHCEENADDSIAGTLTKEGEASASSQDEISDDDESLNKTGSSEEDEVSSEGTSMNSSSCSSDEEVSAVYSKKAYNGFKRRVLQEKMFSETSSDSKSVDSNNSAHSSRSVTPDSTSDVDSEIIKGESEEKEADLMRRVKQYKNLRRRIIKASTSDDIARKLQILDSNSLYDECRAVVSLNNIEERFERKWLGEKRRRSKKSGQKKTKRDGRLTKTEIRSIVKKFVWNRVTRISTDYECSKHFNAQKQLFEKKDKRKDDSIKEMDDDKSNHSAASSFHRDFVDSFYAQAKSRKEKSKDMKRERSESMMNCHECSYWPQFEKCLDCEELPPMPPCLKGIISPNMRCYHCGRYLVIFVCSKYYDPRYPPPQLKRMDTDNLGFFGGNYQKRRTMCTDEVVKSDLWKMIVRREHGALVAKEKSEEMERKIHKEEFERALVRDSKIADRKAQVVSAASKSESELIIVTDADGKKTMQWKKTKRVAPNNPKEAVGPSLLRGIVPMTSKTMVPSFPGSTISSQMKTVVPRAVIPLQQRIGVPIPRMVLSNQIRSTFSHQMPTKATPVKEKEEEILPSRTPTVSFATDNSCHTGSATSADISPISAAAESNPSPGRIIISDINHQHPTSYPDPNNLFKRRSLFGRMIACATKIAMIRMKKKKQLLHGAYNVRHVAYRRLYMLAELRKQQMHAMMEVIKASQMTFVGANKFYLRCLNRDSDDSTSHVLKPLRLLPRRKIKHPLKMSHAQYILGGYFHRNNKYTRNSDFFKQVTELSKKAFFDEQLTPNISLGKKRLIPLQTRSLNTNIAHIFRRKAKLDTKLKLKSSVVIKVENEKKETDSVYETSEEEVSDEEEEEDEHSEISSVRSAPRRSSIFDNRMSLESAFNIKGLPGLFYLAQLVSEGVGEVELGDVMHGPLYNTYRLSRRNSSVRLMMLLSLGFQVKLTPGMLIPKSDASISQATWYHQVFRAMCYGRGDVVKELINNLRLRVVKNMAKWKITQPKSDIEYAWLASKFFKKMETIKTGREQKVYRRRFEKLTDQCSTSGEDIKSKRQTWSDVWTPISWIFYVECFLRSKPDLPAEMINAVTACVLFLKMVFMHRDATFIEKKITNLDIPLELKLLFIITQVPRFTMVKAIARVFAQVQGLDRLAFVGLGRHADPLTVLIEESLLTTDCQLVTHLMNIGRCMEHDSETPEVPQVEQEMYQNRDLGKLFNEELNDGKPLIPLSPPSLEEAFQLRHLLSSSFIPQNLSCDDLMRMLEGEISKYLAAVKLADSSFTGYNLTYKDQHINVPHDNTKIEIACYYCGYRVRKATAMLEFGQDLTLASLPQAEQLRRQRRSMISSLKSYRDIDKEESESSLGPPVPTSSNTENDEEEQPPSQHACQRCRKDLPRCTICTLNYHVIRPEMHHASGDKIAHEFSICHNCNHGGHTQHLVDWFEVEDECPVNECVCRCLALKKKLLFIPKIDIENPVAKLPHVRCHFFRRQNKKTKNVQKFKPYPEYM